MRCWKVKEWPAIDDDHLQLNKVHYDHGVITSNTATRSIQRTIFISEFITNLNFIFEQKQQEQRTLSTNIRFHKIIQNNEYNLRVINKIREENRFAVKLNDIEQDSSKK